MSRKHRGDASKPTPEPKPPAEKPRDPQVSANRIAIVALCFSILAIAFTALQYVEQRETDSVAVRPYLTFTCDGRPNSGLPGLYVQNIGVGPAIITKWDIFYDGTPFEGFTGEDFSRLTHQHEPWQVNEVIAGSSFAAGDREMLFGFETAAFDHRRNQLLFETVGHLYIIVSYASLRGEQWTLKVRPKSERRGVSMQHEWRKIEAYKPGSKS